MGSCILFCLSGIIVQNHPHHGGTPMAEAHQNGFYVLEVHIPCNPWHQQSSLPTSLKVFLEGRDISWWWRHFLFPCGTIQAMEWPLHWIGAWEMVSVPRKCFSMALERNKTTLSVHRQFRPFWETVLETSMLLLLFVLWLFFFLSLSENYLDIVARL